MNNSKKIVLALLTVFILFAGFVIQPVYALELTDMLAIPFILLPPLDPGFPMPEYDITDDFFEGFGTLHQSGRPSVYGMWAK